MLPSRRVAATRSVPAPPCAPTEGVERCTRRPSKVALSTPSAGLVRVTSTPGEAKGPESRACNAA